MQCRGDLILISLTLLLAFIHNWLAKKSSYSLPLSMVIGKYFLFPIFHHNPILSFNKLLLLEEKITHHGQQISEFSRLPLDLSQTSQIIEIASFLWDLWFIPLIFKLVCLFFIISRTSTSFLASFNLSSIKSFCMPLLHFLISLAITN